MSTFSSFVRNTLTAAAAALAMSLVTQGAHAQVAQDPGAKVAPSGVVNINTASAEELERLPGVGPSRAQAVLELREKVKRFQSVDDLMRVKGIGRASLRNMRPMLTLEGPTTLSAAPSAKRSPKSAPAEGAR